MGQVVVVVNVGMCHLVDEEVEVRRPVLRVVEGEVDEHDSRLPLETADHVGRSRVENVLVRMDEASRLGHSENRRELHYDCRRYAEADD